MILITGARGFIGSNLVEHLQSNGESPVSVIRAPELQVDKDRIFLDLNSRDHFLALKKQGIVPDTIIHLAGHIEISLKKHPGDTCAIPVPGKENVSEIYRSNLLPTVNLIEYCLEMGVRHFVFASSQAVYGIPASERITEDSPVNPLEHYAMSKVCCENILRLASSNGLSVSVLRFPGIYSEKRKCGTVYRFCRSAHESRSIKVISDIPLPFDVLHIDDVLDAFSRVISKRPAGYSIYNIGSGEPNSLDLLADRIASLKPGIQVIHAECPQPAIRLDSSKAKATLGWEAKPTNLRLNTVMESMCND